MARIVQNKKITKRRPLMRPSWFMFYNPLQRVRRNMRKLFFATALAATACLGMSLFSQDAFAEKPLTLRL